MKNSWRWMATSSIGIGSPELEGILQQVQGAIKATYSGSMDLPFFAQRPSELLPVAAVVVGLGVSIRGLGLPPATYTGAGWVVDRNAPMLAALAVAALLLVCAAATCLRARPRNWRAWLVVCILVLALVSVALGAQAFGSKQTSCAASPADDPDICLQL
jgi:hypothetical protein